ncbi:MAG: prepilin peptidase [Patescibacteria group bacterium]
MTYIIEHNIFFYLAIFIFGTLIGSFISVVIARWDSEEGFLTGRSRCTECKNTLKPWQMIPVVSWVFQRGCCAFCRNKISFHYPLLEMVTGLLFVVFTYKILPLNGDILGTLFVTTTVFYLTLIAGLIAIFEIDRRTLYIPDIIVYPIAALFVLLLLLDGVFLLGGGPLVFVPAYHNVDLLTIVTGLLVGGGIFGIIALVSKGKWMGWGDVKLGLLLGLTLGPVLAGLALYIAIVAGGLYGIVMLILKKYKKGDLVPFGPFMVLGALTALLFGDMLVRYIFPFLYN